MTDSHAAWTEANTAKCQVNIKECEKHIVKHIVYIVL